MNQWLTHAQPGVQGLTPYQPGKPMTELAREFGIHDAVKLASNENPLGPSPHVLARLQEKCTRTGVARYPDGGGFALKQALAEKLAITPEQITLGNGSNDILELIARVFAGPGDSIVYAEHAFAIYPLATQAVGARHVQVPAKNWGHDLPAMRQAVASDTKIVFIANPNNPTGTWTDRATLEAFLEALPREVIAVVDEAYFEYVEEPDYPNALAWLARFPNLIVARTFSKAYGLAGLRVGYAASSPDIADLLNRVRQPFNVNSFALLAAEVALGDEEHLRQTVATNRAGLKQWEQGLEKLGLAYIPSVGNFLCVDMGRPGETINQALLREGIIVRPVANYGLPNHLRISIGSEAENARGLAALERVLRA